MAKKRKTEPAAEPAATRDAAGLADAEENGAAVDDPADAPDVAEAADEVEAGPDEAGAPDDPVRRLTSELTELKDRHLRLAAEYDNYRKRTQRELADSRMRISADVVRALVDELDDLDRVSELDPTKASAKDVLDGVLLVEKKIWRQLEALGLERVGERDEPFDPNVHEAMGSVPTDDAGRDQTVANVFQPGYRMGAFLIRPARVQVYVHGG